eukprot:255130_1
MIPLDVKEAENIRDNIGKALYSRMFDMVVNRTNKYLMEYNKDKDNILSFGVLDMFGFESFDNNYFEQLCINYANEKLQLYFNQQILKMEKYSMDEYGINMNHVSFSNNRDCIDLIERSKMGIFSSLNEEMKRPNGTDFTWLKRMNKYVLKREKHLNYAKHASKDTFGIIHYAGQVNYNVDGFMKKSIDMLHEHLLIILRNSKNKYISKCFSKNHLHKKKANAMHKERVLSTFKHSMIQLISDLNKTESHFLYCIKPNDEEKCDIFTTSKVLNQLKNCGIFEWIELRNTFSFRMEQDTFFEKYGSVLGAQLCHKLNDDKNATVEMKINAILKRMNKQFDNSELQISNDNRIFFTTNVHQKLMFKMSEPVIIIQCAVRYWIAKKMFNKLKREKYVKEHCEEVKIQTQKKQERLKEETKLEKQRKIIKQHEENEIEHIKLKNKEKLHKYKRELEREMKMRIEIEKKKFEICNAGRVKSFEEYKEELKSEYKHLIDNAYVKEEEKLHEDVCDEIMELKCEKKDLINICKSLQKQLFELNTIERRKDGELEKLKIDLGIIEDIDDENSDEIDKNVSKILDNVFVVASFGTVIGIGDSIYTDFNKRGRYIKRLKAGTPIQLINNTIEMNGHNPGLIIQVKHETIKGWIALHNTSFSESKNR